MGPKDVTTRPQMISFRWRTLLCSLILHIPLGIGWSLPEFVHSASRYNVRGDEGRPQVNASLKDAVTGHNANIRRATATSTASASTSTSTSAFNATAPNLTIAYYGQSNMTAKVSLSQLCAGTSVDIITLAFINSFYGPTDPSKMNITLDFNGYLCQAPNQTQIAAGVTGLLDCTIDGFAAEVAACQAQGKKVLISAGGASANLSMPSQEAAEEVAKTLWDMFLGGSGLKGVRPFGDVVLDGFDIGNEDEKNAGQLFPLISTLRNLTKKDKSRKYYFSAAPICALPDPEIPLSSLLNQIDFWNVQFYNANACQLGSGDKFLDSMKTWSQKLLGKRKLACKTCKVPQGAFNVNGNNITYPRLLIGTRAFDPGASSTGYVNITEYRAILEDVARLGLPNLAGAMFWDGAFLYKEKGLVEGNNRTFAQIAKSVLKDT